MTPGVAGWSVSEKTVGSGSASVSDAFLPGFQPMGILRIERRKWWCLDVTNESSA